MSRNIIPKKKQKKNTDPLYSKKIISHLLTLIRIENKMLKNVNNCLSKNDNLQGIR